MTLVGSAGVGKTRLALRLAAGLREAYPDGVWLVELASLRSPVMVPRSIAAVFEIAERPDRPLLPAIASYLAGQNTLLVLDNCEHVVEVCAEVATELLRRSPNLQIIATSRQVLSVDGELVWRVPSLTAPTITEATGPTGLTGYEAVRLFVERATANQADFKLTPANAAAVAEVCRGLDGIPLAIELAAARLPLLTVEQVAARLTDRFGVLTRGTRGSLPRQQTLAAAVDWSYDLLDTQERWLFERLSVFAGGFSLEAAVGVWSGRPLDPGVVLETLGSLINKSLVQAEDFNGEARYHMLETIRQYASERALASGHAPEARLRAVDHLVRLAEEAEPELFGHSAVPWLKRLELEHDNFRALLKWCLDATETENGLRLGGALSRFWLLSGHLVEGLDWLERLLTRATPAPTVAYAKAVTGAAALASFQWDWGWHRGQNSKARTLAIQAVELWRQLGDDGRLAYALHSLGRTFFTSGDLETARVFWEEALELSRAAGDKAVQSLILVNLGSYEFRRGNEAIAIRFLDEALVLANDAGYAKTRIRVLQYLGQISEKRGDRNTARMYGEQAVSLARSVDDKWEVGRLLSMLGERAARDGDFSRARSLFVEAVDVSRRFDLEAGLVALADDLARLEANSGELERALRLDGAIASWYAAQQVVQPNEWELAERERRAELARRVLGDRAEFAFADGRTLSLAGALDETLGKSPASATRDSTGILTPRELEVVRQLATGKSNRQIADELVVALSTVERHVANILGKLALRSRAQVVIWAAQHGLLAEPVSEGR